MSPALLRNWLISALRGLARSQLQSAIAIGSLAIGLWAVILAGIVVRNQASYDDFVPGYQLLYYTVIDTSGDSLGDSSSTITPSDWGSQLLRYPEVVAISRFSEGTAVFGQGLAMSREDFYWADTNFFRLMRLPALYGDLAHALDRPEGAVLTLSMARKLFGRDDARGRTLDMDHVHPLTVEAVIADLPPNATNLTRAIFVSARAPISPMSHDAASPNINWRDVTTLVQLKAGASIAALNQNASAHLVPPGWRLTPFRVAVHFERLDQYHLSPRLFPGIRPRLYVLSTAALAILILACVNFVNLNIARSLQRGLEVGMRKVAGASRQTLVAQFLGESILQALLTLALALMMVEWSLPAVNAFLDAGAVFDYLRDPYLAVSLVGGTVVVGILAGIYPALVLSSFRPAAALKGLMRSSLAGIWVRQSLVILQFAALIVLMVAAVTVFQQNRFVTTDALRADTDQIIFVKTDTCDSGFRDRVAALPGVRSAPLCTGLAILPNQFMQRSPARPLRTDIPGLTSGFALISMVPVDFGFFELYGVKPLAGRLLRPQAGDRILPNPTIDGIAHYVINDATRRQIGFATPQAAVGQMLPMVSPYEFTHQKPKPRAPLKSQALRGIIVGVVPDFSLVPNRDPLSNGGELAEVPAAYSVGVAIANEADIPLGLLNIKLTGHDIPETVAAIDIAWKLSGKQDPIDRFFLDTYNEQQMIAVLRQGQAFAAFAGIAVLLACLGLFGVALSTTTRRTKEIGVRKAMGADSQQIVALLLWQFSRPVLWANVIAWPAAWWLMRRWLSGFAYHIDLHWWVFAGASLGALLIALAAVAGQAFLTARQKPVLALRYE